MPGYLVCIQKLVILLFDLVSDLVCFPLVEVACDCETLLFALLQYLIFRLQEARVLAID